MEAFNHTIAAAIISADNLAACWQRYQPGLCPFHLSLYGTSLTLKLWVACSGINAISALIERQVYQFFDKQFFMILRSWLRGAANYGANSLYLSPRKKEHHKIITIFILITRQLSAGPAFRGFILSPALRELNGHAGYGSTTVCFTSRFAMHPLLTVITGTPALSFQLA